MKNLAVLGLLSGVLASCSGAVSPGKPGPEGGVGQPGGASSASGGTSGSVAGSQSPGGTSTSSSSSTGPAATGGYRSTGGAMPTGGASASGAGPSTGGNNPTGGVAGTGGNANTGGNLPTGGAAATGGNMSTGGTKATGGAITSGGSPNTGGAKPTGGAAATGGISMTGGTKSTGGVSSMGGSSAQLGCTSSDTTYKLAWSDEFNGATGAAIDSSKWTYDVGGNGWGNSELEYYTSGAANASLDGNGNLVITAKQQSMNGMNYTSARIKTQGLVSWTYGRIEARIKIPKGPGMWPAFWLLGTDIDSNPWPACGEVDVVENIGKEPNIIHGSMHGPGYSGGSGPTAQTSLAAPVGDAFHIFAIEWEQNVIRWYVDNTLYSTKTPSNIPTGANWVYAHPFFIILNVAVGGTWPGNPDSSTVFPQQMLVDYVRVCQH